MRKEMNYVNNEQFNNLRKQIQVKHQVCISKVQEVIFG